MKPPLYGWQGTLLHLGGSILHQGGRHLLIPLPDTEGYLPVMSPMFGLANHDPVP